MNRFSFFLMVLLITTRCFMLEMVEKWWSKDFIFICIFFKIINILHGQVDNSETSEFCFRLFLFPLFDFDLITKIKNSGKKFRAFRVFRVFDLAHSSLKYKCDILLSVFPSLDNLKNDHNIYLINSQNMLIIYVIDLSNENKM